MSTKATDGQGIDQIDRGVGPPSLGVPGEPGNPQRNGQVGLASAGPPTNTMFCASRVNDRFASFWVNARSACETAKSNPARSRCMADASDAALAKQLESLLNQVFNG
jgi:hypothetical protein